jgi:hypothetical protein
MPTIAELLTASRAAHQTYRAHCPHRTAVGGVLVPLPGDPAMARDALDRAATLRKEAFDADPTLTDPAWALDAAINSELMTFYAEQLAR